LTHRHRLRGAAAFAAVLRRGQRLEGDRLQLVAVPAGGTAGRVGYVIGKKLLARAVDRNRLKRMLREAIRARLTAMNAFDVVVRLRRPCAPADIRAAVAEAAALLDALASRTPERRP
jgi:ribonuclease P protein component